MVKFPFTSVKEGSEVKLRGIAEDGLITDAPEKRDNHQSYLNLYDTYKLSIIQ
ncbi:MAG: hypothetical protein II847_01075 [Ruminobacter sp.]|jgi:hypothetical protein|uniref:hypothetical protein n=1 Tax=Ruminobacter sp. TaxID=2774296 RepID=UPI00257B1DA5|nr:hypothetical protein [Ruminobacter sp.]MBQ3774705.1 hypothetical protein [Ruminobacter sp.]